MTAPSTTVAPPLIPSGGSTALVHLSVPGAVVSLSGIAAILPGLGVRHPLDVASLQAPVPFELDPREYLGRKGIRYKDRATLLGTAAAELALAEAGLLGREPSTRTGVVVASCYGNVETVCRVAEEIREGGVASISPMDLPNASSNVVAANIAIRHGLQGVCLSVCNGHDGGWAAVTWATRLITAGRADTVVVVGVESPSVYEAQLRGPRAAPLVDGAAACVVRRVGEAPGPFQRALVSEPVRLTDQGVETASCGGVLDVVTAAALARTTPGRALDLQPPGAGVPWTVWVDG